MNEEWKNETPEKKIERLELVKKCLEAEINMLRNNLQEEREKNKKLCGNFLLMRKVIDLMAEDIKNSFNVLFDEVRNVEYVKEYYFKKARGE